MRPVRLTMQAFGPYPGRQVIDFRDAVEAGQRVVIIDDLLATGGTADAAISLVNTQGSIVAGIGFVIELAGLEGRARLKTQNCVSLLTF